MPDTDSPLSITASVIAIITLVYAVAITLEIYARALRQAEHDNDVLVQAFIQNETGLLGVQEILENLTKRRRQVDTASRSTTNDLALQILMGQSNELYKTAWKCMDDWDKLERLEPIRRKFDYLLVLQIRRSSGYQNWSQERCFATDMRQKAKVWLKFCFLFGIFLLIYLPFALLYNMGVFLHSVTFYNAFAFHIRMMQKQKELTDKMQKVGSNLAELRSQVLLRLLVQTQESNETIASRMTEFQGYLTGLRLDIKKGQDSCRRSSMGRQIDTRKERDSQRRGSV